MSESKTLPGWDGKTYNGLPYISRQSEREVECVVPTHQGTDDEGNAIYDNDCGWTGPVADLDRGDVPIGSRPILLHCPECLRALAAEKGTAGAGYWGHALGEL